MSTNPVSQGQQRTIIPDFVTDPVWSLKPWAIDVELLGHQFVVPEQPAVVWLSALMTEDVDLEQVFPALAGQEAVELVDAALWDGRLDPISLYAMCRDLITMAAGRPWWVAMRLIHSARANWNYIGGEVVIRGIDATHLSLSGWLDAILHVMLRGMERKDQTMFLSRLEVVPEGEQDNGPEMEIEPDAFASMMRD